MELQQGRAVSWRVLVQMATVGASTGFVKVAGAAKVVLTARAFGTSDGLDAYLIALLLPSFVADTLAGSLTSALVPTFIEVRETQGRADANRLYRNVLAGAAALLTGAALLFGILAPGIFRLIASSFDGPKLALTLSMFWIMLPLVPLAAFTVVWRSILNVEGQFAMPALLPGLQPAMSMVFLLAFGKTWGAHSLAVGTIVGAALETALLAVLMVMREFPIVPRWSGRDWAVNQVLAQYAPVIAGVLLLGGSPLIDQSIAGMLAPGSIAALNYGTRFSVVLIAVGPTAVATAILPHFSKLTVTVDWSQIRQSLRSYAVLILAVTVPVVVALIWFSEPLVRLFFQRGAFTGASTALVTQVQRFSLLAIPPAIVMALALRLVSSMKSNRLLLKAAGFALVLNLALDLLLTRWMGIAGITLAASVVQYATVFYLFRLMRTGLPAERPIGEPVRG